MLRRLAPYKEIPPPFQEKRVWPEISCNRRALQLENVSEWAQRALAQHNGLQPVKSQHKGGKQKFQRPYDHF